MSFKSVFERNPICILDKRHRRENWESSNGLFDWLETLLIGWNTLFQPIKKPVRTLSIFTSMAFVKDVNGISFNLTPTWKNGSKWVRPLVVLYSFFFRTHLAPVRFICRYLSIYGVDLKQVVDPSLKYLCRPPTWQNY